MILTVLIFRILDRNLKKSYKNKNALQHHIKLIAGFSPVYESSNEFS
jgi:hypothetical protein